MCHVHAVQCLCVACGCFGSSAGVGTRVQPDHQTSHGLGSARKQKQCVKMESASNAGVLLNNEQNVPENWENLPVLCPQFKEHKRCKLCVSLLRLCVREQFVRFLHSLMFPLCSEDSFWLLIHVECIQHTVYRRAAWEPSWFFAQQF